jgi:divalent metal cation (Fe/Co/Zn/Cd) transporter
VERAIREDVPELRDVHTHIEPLSSDVASAEPRRVEVEAEDQAIRRVVRDVTGAEPERLRFRTDERGLVALLTVGLAGDQSLDAAHEAASELERRIRKVAPAVAEVIVHTEPR